MMNQVVTADFRAPNAPETFVQSLVQTGFGVVSHHPIAFDLIDKMFSEWNEFFESQDKHRYTFDPKTQAGYFPMGTEHAKDSDAIDLKEFYHYYPWWDQNPVEAIPATLTYHAQITELAKTLLQWIEAQTPEDIREAFTMPLTQMIEDSPQTLFRAIYYPAFSGEEPKGAVRAAAHEDINLITLLPAATNPGLEVQDRQGNWHEVPCDPGTIVVNVGDMLQEASGGYYPSTTHRVVNPSDQKKSEPRLSCPLFLHPKPEVRLSKRYTAETYLKQRLEEIGLA